MIFPADFSALKLELDRLTGRLLYSAAGLADTCIANALHPDPILADEDQACSMIAAWYLAHRDRNGAPDDVAEAILARLTNEEFVH